MFNFWLCIINCIIKLNYNKQPSQWLVALIRRLTTACDIKMSQCMRIAMETVVIENLKIWKSRVLFFKYLGSSCSPGNYLNTTCIKNASKTFLLWIIYTPQCTEPLKMYSRVWLWADVVGGIISLSRVQPLRLSGLLLVLASRTVCTSTLHPITIPGTECVYIQ